LVCDLARMTFICDRFDAAQATLELICSAQELDASMDLEPFLLKNRLMASFNAAESGGYRDVLINARDRSNGHIVEIQITLRGLFSIKAGGGHSEYKLTRVLDLNDPSVTRYKGELTKDVIEKVRRGMIHSLSFSTGLNVHFEDLVSALAAPTCLVNELDCGHGPASGENGFPPGKTLSDLFTTEVCAQLRPRLERVNMPSCQGIRGEIPSTLYECTRIKWINFSQSVEVTGSISPLVKNLVKLEAFLTWGSGMSGALPRELFSMPVGGHHHDPHTFSCMYEGGRLDGCWRVGRRKFSLDMAELAFQAHLAGLK
jgi:hypothetical protein